MNKNTRILAVCSTVDFKNFTRRATLDAIFDLHPEMNLLLFNGIKARFQEKVSSDRMQTNYYHNWLPGRLEKNRMLQNAEGLFRKPSWSTKLNKYEVLFFSDPNQYPLLNYLGNQKVVYLLRDPNILQDSKHRYGERKLLERADIVLATSRNLIEKYLSKYYSFQHPNIHYWPNTADLDLWNSDKITTEKTNLSIIGVAGNFSSKRTDYNLLKAIVKKLPDLKLEIAGNIDREENPEFWNELLLNENVTYLGFIPLDKLPGTVARWHAGLVTDRIDEYASYMHHNKIYQYLAMGVPAVSFNIHDDYDELHPYVQVAETIDDYVKTVKQAIVFGTDEKFKKSCKMKAIENSARNRAERFLEILQRSGIHGGQP